MSPNRRPMVCPIPLLLYYEGIRLSGPPLFGLASAQRRPVSSPQTAIRHPFGIIISCAGKFVSVDGDTDSRPPPRGGALGRSRAQKGSRFLSRRPVLLFDPFVVWPATDGPQSTPHSSCGGVTLHDIACYTVFSGTLVPPVRTLTASRNLSSAIGARVLPVVAPIKPERGIQRAALSRGGDV